MTDATSELRPLYELDTGLRIEQTLVEDVPYWLARSLRDWLLIYLRGFPAVGETAALRLQRSSLIDAYGRELTGVANNELLRVIHVVLQLSTEILTAEADHAEETQHGPQWPDGYATPQVNRLEHLLANSGSAYTVSWGNPVQLSRRMSPGVNQGVQHVLATADQKAGEFLREALRHTYGLDPDPVAAYAAAVKAVEHVAGPLILPNDPEPSLGTVTRHLEDAPGKWRLSLAGKDGDDSPEPVTKLMRRLFGGQCSRHAGGTRNRDQTQEEAEAATQIAVLLVQLLSAGSLTRR